MISIILPTTNGNRLKYCLESIRKSSYQDFEVIANNVSGNPELTEIIKEFGFKEIAKKTGILESRYLCVIGAKGGKVLLLSDTRTISGSLLRQLADLNNDIIIIGEKEIGKSLLTKLQDSESSYIKNIDVKSLDPLTNRFILPRAYSTPLLKTAMERIKSNLPPNIFRDLAALDQEIIYLEAFSISRDIGIIRDANIFHYGDENLFALWRKYYKYGKHTRAVWATKYAPLSNLGGRLLVKSEHGSSIRNIPILTLKGIPCLVGYLSSLKS